MRSSCNADHVGSAARIRLLPFPEVTALTTYSRATIYRKVHEGTFPSRLSLDRRKSLGARTRCSPGWLLDRGRSGRASRHGFIALAAAIPRGARAIGGWIGASSAAS